MVSLRVVCKCGYSAGISNSYSSHSLFSGTIPIYKDVKYVCAECGKEMVVQVVKIDTKKTETVVKEY